ncbi:MAG: hypothetical protein HC890_20030 [Chloroflexaceae bacterium]|nr:hypothetical protein [Chloroflexaceae bacterium]
MFSLDLTLKNTPFPVSIQRKEAEAAEALYQEILEAMRGQQPEILELTCEKQPEKKVAVLVNQISTLTLSQKSGAMGAGRVPGFVAGVME